MCQSGQHRQFRVLPRHLFAQDERDGTGPSHQRLEHEAGVNQLQWVWRTTEPLLCSVLPVTIPVGRFSVRTLPPTERREVVARHLRE